MTRVKHIFNSQSSITYNEIKRPLSHCLPMETIGERIKWARESLGMKQQASLAQALGVSVTAVSLWENSKGIKLENLVQIADMAKVSLDWLALGRGEPRFLARSASENEEMELLPLVRAAVFASLDLLDHKFPEQFRNLVVEGIVRTLVIPEGGSSLLPKEIRDRLLDEAGGSAFLERAKFELPTRSP